MQEAKFRGLNVFDGLYARCAPDLVPEPPSDETPHPHWHSATVSLSVAQPLSNSALIPAAAEGVALLLKKGALSST